MRSRVPSPASASRSSTNFESGGQHLRPQDAEQLVAKIFAACGYDVTETGFVGGDQGVDCYSRGIIDGKSQTIAVGVKYGNRPADMKSVRQAFALKNQSPVFDRAMVISRAGFSLQTLEEAETLGLGEIDSLAQPPCAAGSPSRLHPKK